MTLILSIIATVAGVAAIALNGWDLIKRRIRGRTAISRRLGL